MPKFNSFPDRVNVRTAAKNRSNFDLSHSHITTSDFGRVKPVLIRECVRDEDIRLNLSMFMRMSPLDVPCYGNIRHKMYAFYCPSRLLQDDFEAFITSREGVNSDGTKYWPQVYQVTSLAHFWACIFSTYTARSLLYNDPANKYDNDPNVWAVFRMTNRAGEPEEYDTTHYDFYRPGLAADGTLNYSIYQSELEHGGTPARYLTFTPEGRKVVDTLLSLGYNLDIDATTPVSLLPLVARLRIYEEWFMPAAYSNNIYHPNLTTNHGSKLDEIWGDHPSGNAREVARRLFGVHYSSLDKDYFTAAWQHPLGNNSADILRGTASGFQNVNGREQLEQTLPHNDTQTVPNGAIGIGGTNAGLTQYALDVLKAVTNWFKRRALTGSRYYEQLLSEYGKVPDEARIDRTELIGTSSTSVQISDIMSNSDTASASLGSYAGKGIGMDSGLNVNYHTEEPGYLIVFSVIMPETSIVTGIDRNLLHTKPLQFFTPDFEQIGTQAIGLNELTSNLGVPYNSTVPFYVEQNAMQQNAIFGFVPMYAEYKTKRSLLTGDFRIPRLNATLDSWHLFRQLSTNYILATGNIRGINVNYPQFAGITRNDGDFPVRTSESFSTLNNLEARDFSRIFNVADQSVDHFTLVYDCALIVNSPMCSLSDSIVTDGGKEVQVQYNGIQLN